MHVLSAVELFSRALPKKLTVPLWGPPTGPPDYKIYSCLAGCLARGAGCVIFSNLCKTKVSKIIFGSHREIFIIFDFIIFIETQDTGSIDM